MVTTFPQQSGDQSQFSYPLTPLTLTPALVGLPQMVNTGLRIPGWIVVYNESPYQITVQRPSDGYNIPLAPQTVDKLQLKLGDTVIYITPKILLPQAAPSFLVNFQVYYDDPKGTYPMELTRQAAPVPAAGALGFTARLYVPNTASTVQQLNVYNPTTSGKAYKVVRARASSNDTGSPTANLFFFPGTDNNYGTPVGATLGVLYHQINPPASQNLATTANVSASDNGSFSSIGNTIPETVFVGSFTNQDLMQAGDQYTVYPGTNIIVNLSSGTTGHISILTLEYYEQ